MTKAFVQYLSRRCRRRRIWMAAKVSALGRQLRSKVRHPPSSAARGDARPSTTSVSDDSDVPYSGIECSSVDALVDFPAMWGRLESLLAAPKSRTALGSAELAGAVPILLASGLAPAELRPLRAASLLLPGAGASRRDSGLSPRASDPRFVIREDVRVREGANGRGVFAAAEIPAGSTLLVEKPAVAVLDLETRREKPWAEHHAADTGALACSVAAALAGPRREELLALMAPLHPREGSELPPPPARTARRESEDEEAEEEEEGEEEDAELEAQMAVELGERFAAVPGGEGLRARMEAVARLNGLGYYSHSEQLCYTASYQFLTGTALCLVASAFNHSCAPNVTRFAIGDVLVFRTNTCVRAGEELCISYIESETLCEHRRLRRQALDRDFECMCSKCSAEDRAAAAHKEPPDDDRYFSVDAELQEELAAMPPCQRIDICKSLLAGRLPAEFGGEEGGGEAVVKLLLKDAQELRAVLGLALAQSGGAAEARRVWAEAARLTASSCPPFDEALYVYALHAALCAASAEETAWAQRHMIAAVQLFWGAFGGDGSLELFRRCCARELQMAADLTPGREARLRQQSLLSSLEPAPLARPSWEEMRAEVLGWQVPKKGREQTKKKAAHKLKSKVHAQLLAKPKAAVVNGLRVLP